MPTANPPAAIAEPRTGTRIDWTTSRPPAAQVPTTASPIVSPIAHGGTPRVRTAISATVVAIPAAKTSQSDSQNCPTASGVDAESPLRAARASALGHTNATP